MSRASTVDEFCNEAMTIAEFKGQNDREQTNSDFLFELFSSLTDLKKAFDDFSTMTYQDTVWWEDSDDTSSPDQPDGVPIHLADHLIKIFQFCQLHGIDLTSALRIQLDYLSSN